MERDSVWVITGKRNASWASDEREVLMVCETEAEAEVGVETLNASICYDIMCDEMKITHFEQPNPFYMGDIEVTLKPFCQDYTIETISGCPKKCLKPIVPPTTSVRVSKTISIENEKTEITYNAVIHYASDEKPPSEWSSRKYRQWVAEMITNNSDMVVKVKTDFSF